MKDNNKFNIKECLDEGFWFLPIDDLFMTFKQSTLDFDDQQKRRVFIDKGNSNVLFVAHLDTVLEPKVKYKTLSGNKIYAQGLDDRLGCCVAYHLSRMLNVDLLLCDNEEKGISSAQYHVLKDYNWIAEFDRAGDDVVTYDIDSDDFLDKLKYHFKIGWGSYSDICLLDTTACCLNIGVGYELSHSRDSYADLNICNTMIESFIGFYNLYKHVRFTADYTYSTYRRSYNLDDAYMCEVCDIEYGEDIYGHVLCRFCFNSMWKYNGFKAGYSADGEKLLWSAADGRYF